MEWCRLYNQSAEPSMQDISDYIHNELWQKLNLFLQSEYKIKPQLSYSRCKAQPGWNVKYRKSGKSLCTLYPMDGYFIALVVIGEKENHELELTLSSYSEYVQTLYKNTPFSCGGRWLMIDVTEPSALDDVLRLIQIRAKPKISRKSE